MQAIPERDILKAQKFELGHDFRNRTPTRKIKVGKLNNILVRNISLYRFDKSPSILATHKPPISQKPNKLALLTLVAPRCRFVIDKICSLAVSGGRVDEDEMSCNYLHMTHIFEGGET